MFLHRGKADKIYKKKTLKKVCQTSENQWWRSTNEINTDSMFELNFID